MSLKELNEYMRSRCKWCACCDVYIGRAVECGGFSNDGLTSLGEGAWVSVPSLPAHPKVSRHKKGMREGLSGRK